LGGSGFPPPGSSDDLFEEFGFLFGQPGFPLRLGAEGEAFPEAHVPGVHMPE
jgi:hypothetical protein